MKAISAAAIAGDISLAALYGSGLTTGLIRPIAKLAIKPVVRAASIAGVIMDNALRRKWLKI